MVAAGGASSSGAACALIGEDSTSASSVLLPGVVAGSGSILLLLVNVETVYVDKMIPENKKTKKGQTKNPVDCCVLVLARALALVP